MYVYMYMYIQIFVYEYIHAYPYIHIYYSQILNMGRLRLVGSLKLYVSFAKEPFKRDDILQKRPIIVRSLLIVATQRCV